MQKNNHTHKVSLAIDTSIGGGSFSLWRNDQEIEYVIGNTQNSRSTDILLIIDSLLRKHKLDPSQLDKIIHTNGPGNFTGLRVGSATIQGLQKSLKCKAFVVSVPEAISVELNREDFSEGSAAMLILKNKVVLQKFRLHDKAYIAQEQTEFFSLTDFSKLIIEHNANIVMNNNLYLELSQKESNIEKEQIHKVASDNVAGLAYQFYLVNKEYVESRTIDLILYGE